MFIFLQSHDAPHEAVRYRCCQLINNLLNSMGDDAQIDDELYDRIYECMLQRLRDVFPIVRVHAVFALARLQDPTDLDCPIINGEPTFSLLTRINSLKENEEDLQALREESC